LAGAGVITFLILALVAGFVLIAVIDKGSKRGGYRGGKRVGPSRATGPSLNRAQVAERWTTIETMAATGGGNGLRQAVSEADKLMDQALRQAGVRGETMGERLKNARDRFSNRQVYENIWRAHKLRNALAHQIGYDLVPSQAKEALTDFERGLRTMGML